MSKLTLKYFNVRYLAEPSRLILNYVGEPFEDVRIPFREWPVVKPSKQFINFTFIIV